MFSGRIYFPALILHFLHLLAVVFDSMMLRKHLLLPCSNYTDMWAALCPFDGIVGGVAFGLLTSIKGQGRKNRTELSFSLKPCMTKLTTKWLWCLIKQNLKLLTEFKAWMCDPVVKQKIADRLINILAMQSNNRFVQFYGFTILADLCCRKSWY